MTEDDSYKERFFSQAGCRFQREIVSILNPTLAISVLPSFCGDTFSAKPIANTIFLRSWGKHRTRLWKTLRIFKMAWLAAKQIENCGVRRLLIYNADPVGLLVHTLVSVNHTRTYFLIADWPNVANAPWRRCLEGIIASASGVVALSSRIKLHSRQINIPGVAARLRAPISNSNFFTRGKIRVLLSGSLGVTTGLQVALEAAKSNGNVELIITGRPFRMNEAELVELIKSYQVRDKNITYKGLLDRNSFEETLQSVDVVLSLRNPSDCEHIGNIPSKIIEAACFGKLVISSIRYPELPECVISHCDFTPESVNSALDSAVLQGESERARSEKTRKASILATCGVDVVSLKIHKFIADEYDEANNTRII